MPEDLLPAAVLTAGGLVALVLISNFVMQYWVDFYARDYGGFGVVPAIYFWILFSSALIVAAASLSPALAERRNRRAAAPNSNRGTGPQKGPRRWERQLHEAAVPPPPSLSWETTPILRRENDLRHDQPLCSLRRWLRGTVSTPARLALGSRAGPFPVSRERETMRSLTVEATSLQSAERLCIALSAFGAQLIVGDQTGGYYVCVDLGGTGDWRVFEVLNVLAKHALSEIAEPTDQTHEASLLCTECGREPRPGENGQDEWRAYSHGTSEMMIFCPQCAGQEFGT